MTPKEQKDLLMGYHKIMYPASDEEKIEKTIDQYLATLTTTSERYKATIAFFDKLPDGLREMAKENYEEGFDDCVPDNTRDALNHGFDFEKSEQGADFWYELRYALFKQLPSITLNGTTYDLTKCYEKLINRRRWTTQKR